MRRAVRARNNGSGTRSGRIASAAASSSTISRIVSVAEARLNVSPSVTERSRAIVRIAATRSSTGRSDFRCAPPRSSNTTRERIMRNNRCRLPGPPAPKTIAGRTIVAPIFATIFSASAFDSPYGVSGPSGDCSSSRSPLGAYTLALLM